MSVRVRAMLAVLPLVLVTGCQSAGKGAEGTAALAAPTPASAEQEPPVVYDVNAASQPLSAEQREEILTLAKEHCPKGRSIWFLYVRSNREYEGKLYHETSVYYSPDQQTRRLRRGSYIGVGVWLSAVLSADVPHRYCQVSTPSEPFGEELGEPEGLLLPFPAPEGFSDAEIVEVVDSVFSLKKEHDAFNYSQWFYPAMRARERGHTIPPLTTLFHFSPADSIQQIEGYGEAVDVSIGSWEGPLSARCAVFRCMKTRSGYKVMWCYFMRS